MSTATASPTMAAPAATTAPSSLRRATIGVGLAGAAATTAVAAAAHSAGVPLEVDGGMIPLAGFAQMTLLGAVLGGVLLAALRRRRTSFLQVTAALTALSCVPSVTWPPDAATKLTLVATHVLAAAIIVPVLARHAATD